MKVAAISMLFLSATTAVSARKERPSFFSKEKRNLATVEGSCATCKELLPGYSFFGEAYFSEDFYEKYTWENIKSGNVKATLPLVAALSAGKTCYDSEEDFNSCQFIALVSEAVYRIDILKCLLSSITKTARELICFLYTAIPGYSFDVPTDEPSTRPPLTEDIPEINVRRLKKDRHRRRLEESCGRESTDAELLQCFFQGYMGFDDTESLLSFLDIDLSEIMEYIGRVPDLPPRHLHEQRVPAPSVTPSDTPSDTPSQAPSLTTGNSAKGAKAAKATKATKATKGAKAAKAAKQGSPKAPGVDDDSFRGNWEEDATFNTINEDIEAALNPNAVQVFEGNAFFTKCVTIGGNSMGFCSVIFALQKTFDAIMCDYMECCSIEEHCTADQKFRTELTARSLGNYLPSFYSLDEWSPNVVIADVLAPCLPCQVAKSDGCSGFCNVVEGFHQCDPLRTLAFDLGVMIPSDMTLTDYQNTYPWWLNNPL